MLGVTNSKHKDPSHICMCPSTKQIPVTYREIGRYINKNNDAYIYFLLLDSSSLWTGSSAH